MLYLICFSGEYTVSKFVNIMKGLFCFLYFSFVSILSANVVAEDVDDIVFVVQPKICVLATYETYCMDEIEILWESKLNRTLCLYRGVLGNEDAVNSNDIHNNQALRCWKNMSEGRYELTINTRQSINFYLKEVGQEGLLISKPFKVIQDTQRYRRRHRNPWSFF